MIKLKTLFVPVVVTALAGASGLAAAQTHPSKKAQAERDAGRAEFEARFKAADTNGDGGLSKQEASAATSGEFGAIREHFDEMDTNKDGKVTLDEHRAYLRSAHNERKKNNKDKREDYAAQFKAVDKNGDGGLSKDELAAAGAGQFDAIRKHFDEMDTNHDGKVTQAEHRAYEQAQRAAKKK
jgi:Ca2+-binding EF-hand superfamily protein